MRIVILFLLLVSCLSSKAQLLDVSLEPFAVHEGLVGNTDLTGYITWRVYAEFESPLDYLQTVSADLDGDSIVINSTLPFFQSEQAGFFESELPCELFEIFPEAEYDSFLTLGRAHACEPDGPTENFIGLPQFSVVSAQFEAGENISIYDGQWGFPLQINNAGFAGDDNRVLIAQLTTQGTLDLRFNLDYIPDGQALTSVTGITLQSGPIGCTHPLAVNFDPSADVDDGSCEFQVNFHVDLYNENDSPGSVRVRGSWNDYCADCANLDDIDGDNIWTGFAIVPEGEFGYFYTYGGTNSEILFDEPLPSCVDLHDGVYARTIQVPEELETDTLCFNQCVQCEHIGCSDPEANNYDPFALEDSGLCSYGALVKVIREIYYEDDGTVDGYPAGAKTYRIYALMDDGTDFLSSGFGASPHTLKIGTTTGQIWNSATGATTGDLINAALFIPFPTTEFDSFITIGRASTDDPGGTISAVSTNPLGVFDDAFGAGDEDEIDANAVAPDGAWYTTNGNANGFGVGPDNRVLLAQITSTEDVYYNLNLQVFDEGEGENSQFYFHDFADGENEYTGEAYGLVYPVGYCSEPAACNYVPDPPPEVPWSLEFCEFESCAGCTDEAATNYDPFATLDNLSCIYDCSESILLLNQISLNGSGWNGATYEVYEFPIGLIASGTMTNNISDMDTICHSSDCIFISIGGGTADELIAWELSNGYGEDIANGYSTSGILLYLGEEECGTPGCMNPLADNYNPEAVWDVGTCVIGGCTNPEGSNYNPDATYDDGSCCIGIAGCTNSSATNYFPEATCSAPDQCIWGNYSIVVEEFYEDDESVDDYPPGFRTFRLYAVTQNEDDQLLSIFSTDGVTEPATIEVQADGFIWNHVFGDSTVASQAPDVFDLYPSLPYDSYVTIGQSEVTDPGSYLAASEIPGNALTATFDTQAGVDLNMPQGAWTTVELAENGIAGEDNKIFIGQVTSADGICGTLSMEVWEHGETAYRFYNLPFCSDHILGCTDPAAANYLPTATQDDSNCEYGEYFLSCETIYVDDGSVEGYPEGFSTYQVFLNTQNNADALTSIFGDNMGFPMTISSTGTIWNDDPSMILGEDIIAEEILLDPVIAYDSFITVGAANDEEMGGGTGYDCGLSPAVEDFFGLGSINEILTENCYWHSNWSGANTLAGDDQKVLVAQITTDGQIFMQTNAEIYYQNLNYRRFEVFGLSCESPAIEGCTDETAINYNPLATIDDESCVFPCLPQIWEMEYFCSWDTEIEELVSAISMEASWLGDCVTDSVEFLTVGFPELNYTFPVEFFTPTIINSGDSVFVNLPGTIPPETYAVNLIFADGSSIEEILVVTPCIAGCTDPLALNYNELATVDDESCDYDFCPGTMFEIQVTTVAFGNELSWFLSDELDEIILSGGGYGSNETHSDSICLDPGCFKLTMLDSFGDGWNGGSYEYFLDGFFGGSSTLEAGEQAFDLISVLENCPVDGCTDPDALNYDPSATVPDGSCVYNSDEPAGGNNDEDDDDLIVPPSDVVGDSFDIEFENLNTQNSLSVQIFNSVGKLCFTGSYIPQSSRADLRIGMNDMASGVYYLQVINGDQSDALQFVHRRE